MRVRNGGGARNAILNSYEHCKHTSQVWELRVNGKLLKRDQANYDVHDYNDN
jgi:hypothetical protein